MGSTKKWEGEPGDAAVSTGAVDELGLTKNSEGEPGGAAVPTGAVELPGLAIKQHGAELARGFVA